jgi:hypothetical protein
LAVLLKNLFGFCARLFSFPVLVCDMSGAIGVYVRFVGRCDVAVESFWVMQVFVEQVDTLPVFVLIGHGFS